MALSSLVNRLAFTSGADGTAFTSGSFTVPANSLALMFVAAGHATAGEEPSSFGGTLGLTWTKMGNSQTTTTPTMRGTWYRAMTGGSSATGTVTANFATTHSSCEIIVDTTDGHDTTTPIRQVATPFQSTTTDNPGITHTLSIVAGNMTVGANIWNRTFVLPVGSGYTQSGAVTNQTSPTMICSTEYKLAGAQLVDWTTTDNIEKVLFAIEVAAGAGGPAAGGWVLGSVAVS